MFERGKAWLEYQKIGLFVGAVFGATYSQLLVDYPRLITIIDYPAKLFSTFAHNHLLTIFFPIVFYAMLGAFLQSKVRSRLK